MYNNIISIGFNCAVAASLRKYGLRNRDYPFDWGVSKLTGVLAAVSERFADFLDESWITDIGDGMYYHNKYQYNFAHDFQDGIWNAIDFQGQMQCVKNKYRKKICNFLNDLECGGALFVRQVQDLQEAEYIVENMEFIQGILHIGLDQGNNSIIWIGNKPAAEYLRERKIPVYEAEIEWEDGRTGRLLDRNPKLKQSLLYGQIDSGRQVENLLYAQYLQDEKEKKASIELSIMNKLLNIMYDCQKKKLLKNSLWQKKFVIYGAGNLGMAFGGMLKNIGLYPMYYLDKYKRKAGTFICDREVVRLQQASEYEEPDIIIMAIPYEGNSFEEVSDRLGQNFSQSRIEGIGAFLECFIQGDS